MRASLLPASVPESSDMLAEVVENIYIKCFKRVCNYRVIIFNLTETYYSR